MSMNSESNKDREIIDSWYKNAAAWITAIQEQQIASRKLVTNRSPISIPFTSPLAKANWEDMQWYLEAYPTQYAADVDDSYADRIVAKLMFDRASIVRDETRSTQPQSRSILMMVDISVNTDEDLDDGSETYCSIRLCLRYAIELT
jgi:hypothetical protein